MRVDPWIGKIPWRRKRQRPPVFLPGKSHGQRNLAGYSTWCCKESDTAEQLNNKILLLAEIQSGLSLTISHLFFFFFEEFHLYFITIMVIVYNNLTDSHIWVKIFCEKAAFFFSVLYVIYLCRRHYPLCFDTSHLFFIPVLSRITFLSFNTKRQYLVLVSSCHGNTDSL